MFVGMYIDAREVGSLKSKFRVQVLGFRFRVSV